MCKFGYLIKLILLWGIGYYSTSLLISSRVSINTATLLDSFIPFIPWTGWIYVSLLLWMFFVGRIILSAPLWYHFFRCYEILILTSLAFFIIIPTEAIRLLSDSFIMNLIYFLDPSSHKALPSLHISMMIVPILYLWKMRYESFWWVNIWALLIAISCLTTKQHNILDIFGGITISLIVYYFFKEIRYYRK
mgnify:CR=1 FL=1